MSEYHNNKLYLACAISAALATSSISTVHAQEDEDFIDDIPVLEEIIVTARKRQESLQDTPVAVSALGAEALQEAGIYNTRDLQMTVPGLTFSEQGSKTPSIYIRGVGQRESNAALDPGVGVYINGIYIARTDSQLLDTVDTQSVQILRGPQGTLFGKNNTGGAIIVTTQMPHIEAFEGYVTARIGNYGRQDIKVGANIPLNEDSMSTRISFTSVKRDGYFPSTANGNEFGDEDRLAATGRFLWEVNDVFSVDLFAYWSKQNELGAPFSCFATGNEKANFNQFNFTAPDGSEVKYEQACQQSEEAVKKNKVTMEGTSVFKMTNMITAATLSWEFDDYEIKSITSFSKQSDILIEDDQDATALDILHNGHVSYYQILDRVDDDGFSIPHDEEERTQFSQEIQLIGSAFDESLQFTLGAFYAKEEMDNNPWSQLIGPSSFMRLELLGTKGIHTFLGTESDLKNKTVALFAQGTYDVTDWFQLTLGGRYTIEEREKDTLAYAVNRGLLVEQIQPLEPRVPGAILVGESTLIPGFLEYPSIDVFNQIADIYNSENIIIPLVQSQSGACPAVAEAEGTCTTKPGLRQSETWSRFTPTITTSFNIPEELFEESNLDSALIYFTYSRGFKAGGFDNKGGELIKFKPEEVDNFEMGIKMDAFERRLRFNTAFYRMSYDDIQIRVAQQGENLADILLFIANAGEATIEGMELELAVLPMNNLTITATGNYTNATYDEFLVETSFDGVVDRSKEDYASIPKISGSLTGSYDWVTNIGLLTPRLTVYYSDEVYTGIDHFAPNYEVSTIDSYTLWNFRLAYIPEKLDDLNVTLYIDNLTDETYFRGGFTVAETAGAANLTRGAPRTYGLEATYTF